MIRTIAISAFLFTAAACSPPAQEPPVPVEGVPTAAEAPAEVLAAIQAEEPGFVASAAVADNTTGAQTYKVTGTGEGARTYNVMHFNEGWKVVQITRELSWGDAPQAVRDVVATSPQAVVPDRVVETRDVGADGVIYDLYVGGAQTPALSVREAGGEAAIMPPPH